MNENEQENLAETDNFVVWKSSEEGDVLYHVELGGITLHITPEEWNEFVTLIKSVEG